MTRTEATRLIRRLAVPVGSLVLVLAAVTLATSELTARLERLDRRIAQVERDTADKVGKIRRKRAGLDFVRAHRDSHRAAREAGFLAPQDRLAAGDLLEQLAVETDLNSVDYTFAAARRAPLGRGDDGPALAATPLDIQVQASFDQDIFAFLDKLRDQLPGYVVLRQGSMQRVLARDLADAPADLAANGRPNVVSATLSLAWVRLAFPQEDGADG
ncbi:hypothetical protein SAMN05216241_102227 [Limimonas halophila]|uniref:Type II secretion system (T2SS), protein M subtype b n=1 Tax=Limimonas halophila TaxID=1082479 RepID=A0A1G7NMN8_9PROT|nr:hypothetical protein [Limimonas halophila]SDF75236.1 hypothetical protein SAMN05216241_102227 [Limimonas halophila]